MPTAGAHLVDRWLLPGDLARALDRAPARRPPRTARDWLVDTVLFAAAALVWFAEFENTVVNDAYALPTVLRVADPVLGVLLCAALWWRRRFPMAVAVAAMVAAAVSNTATGAVVVALFSLALHRGWRPALLVLALGIPLGLPYLVIFYPRADGDDPATSLLVIVLGLAVIVAVAAAVRARRHLVLVLDQRARDQRRDYERRLEDTRRDERRRIAREMHDVLAHRISLLTVHAGALEYRAAAAERGAAAPLAPAEVRAAVGIMREAAGTAVDELRDVLHLLRSPDDAPEAAAQRHGVEPPATGGAGAALDTLLAEAAAGGGRVDADVAVELDALRVPVGRTVVRLVQEGLTNARKHAPGLAVTLSVSDEPDGALTVTLSNPVPGGEVGAVGAGVGLIGLAERVAQHAGTLAHGVTDGRFVLAARLPGPTR